MRYVCSKKYKILCREDCYHVKNIKEENRVWFETIAEGVNYGCRPCKHCKPYEKLTEEEALEKLNHQESITKEEANDILFSLCDAVKDRIKDLPERILGTYSYYEGIFKGMDIAIKMLSKLK